MAHISIRFALVSTALIAILGCSRSPSGFEPQAMNFHPLTSGLTLNTVIGSDTARTSLLRISLANVGGTTLNVMTGRNAAYPAAHFTFQIELQDHRRFDLICDICGAVGIASGRPLHYWVELPPGAGWHVDLPLRGFLYIDSGDRRLDNIDATEATITTSLRGVQPQEGIDVAHGETVWVGTASANVILPAFQQTPRRLRKRFLPGHYTFLGRPEE